MLPTMLELFGAGEAHALLGRTARLIGLQFHDEIAATLGIAERDADAFAQWLAAVAAAQGERVTRGMDGHAAIVRQQGWRLIEEGAPSDIAAFQAWYGLWEGALAAHNRQLRLTTIRDGGGIVWRIQAQS